MAPNERLRKLIVICFHLLFLLVPFFFTWINEELFEFPKMLLTYGLTTIITALWAVRMISVKKFLFKPTAFDWPLLFFLISQTLSTIFSIHPQTSIFGYYTRFHGGLLSTLSYSLLFYAFVNNVKQKELDSLWLSIFVAALGVSLYAIPEHFGHSPSCLIITGKFDVGCWVQKVQDRVFATFGQPNWLAAYAITLLPMSLVKTIKSSPRWRQALTGATSLGLFLTLLYTSSRSGLLGLGVGLAVLTGGWWWLEQRQPQAKTAQFPRYLLLLVVLIIIAGLNGTSFSPSVSKVFSPQPQSVAPTPKPKLKPTVNRLETGGTDSGEIRQIVWQGALAVWRRYPLVGSGTATFAYSYYQDRPLAHNLVSEWDFLYNKAHNEFLNFLATTGAMGLAAYLSLLIWFGVVCLQLWRSAVEPAKIKTISQPLYALALLAGVVALSVSNFFGFSTVMVSILLFSYLAMINVWRDNQVDEQKISRLQLSGGQWLGLAVIALMSLSILIKISQIWVADKAYATGKSYIQAGYTQQGLDKLQAAVELRPREALFHNQLADTYAQLAVTLESQKQSTAAAEFKDAALTQSDLTLQLNPRHLNFYKTQTRVLISLSQLEPELLNTAQGVLSAAMLLSPTDAKLRYNLGLIQLSLGKTEVGMKTLEETVNMKANYEAARLNLGKQYEAQGKIEQARQQYQYIYDHITTNNQTVNEKLGITL